MALRAGYFGLKRFEKNKLSVLAASMPADISPDNPMAGIDDVLTSIDLLDETVGWISKNKVDSSNGTTAGTNIFTYNSSDKTVTANGTGGLNNSQYSIPINVSGDFYFLGCPEGGANMKYDVYMYDNTAGARVKQWDGTTQSLSNYGSTPCQCQIPEGHNVVLTLRVFADVTVENIIFKPMVISKEDYELLPAYAPHHESVAEMFAKVVNLAFTITTDNYTGDIDNLDAGIRYCTNAAAHNPGNSWGYCITIKNPSNKIQLFIGQASTGIWYRRYASSAWQAWNAVTLTEVTGTREETKATKKKVIKEEEE